MPGVELLTAASTVLEKPWRPGWECARCRVDRQGPPPGPAADGALYCVRCLGQVGGLVEASVAKKSEQEPAAVEAKPRPAPDRKPCGCRLRGPHFRMCPLGAWAKKSAEKRAEAPAPEPPRTESVEVPGAPPAPKPGPRIKCVAMPEAPRDERRDVPVECLIPRALDDHLRALLATGLHGRTYRECAERMIARGVESVTRGH